jgi:hypothetical protein
MSYNVERTKRTNEDVALMSVVATILCLMFRSECVVRHFFRHAEHDQKFEANDLF